MAWKKTTVFKEANIECRTRNYEFRSIETVLTYFIILISLFDIPYHPIP